MAWLGVYFQPVLPDDCRRLGSVPDWCSALLPIYRERRMRRKQAVYMAMRLAVIMENFAWACAVFAHVQPRTMRARLRATNDPATGDPLALVSRTHPGNPFRGMAADRSEVGSRAIRP